MNSYQTVGPPYGPLTVWVIFPRSRFLAGPAEEVVGETPRGGRRNQTHVIHLLGPWGFALWGKDSVELWTTTPYFPYISIFSNTVLKD